MNEWWKKEVNTLLHILTEKTTANTMQIQCLLLADGTKPLNIQIQINSQPLLQQLLHRFDWIFIRLIRFIKSSQEKEKSKSKEQSEFWHHDVIHSMSSRSFLFRPSISDIQYCIFNIRADWFDLWDWHGSIDRFIGIEFHAGLASFLLFISSFSNLLFPISRYQFRALSIIRANGHKKHVLDTLV